MTPRDPKLIQESFDRLLRALDPDRDRAAAIYEIVRLKLVKFFEWRDAVSPEDLADRTIDRVVTKVDAGETILRENPSNYFYAVAQNILKESWSEQKKELRAFQELAASIDDVTKGLAEAPEAEGREKRLRCLERCLAALSPESRQLILRYYEGAEHEKIRTRKEIAGDLDIPLNALRIRAYRLRTRLESCIRDCLKEPEGEMKVPSIHIKGQERGGP